jgi:hypothetical protein
MLLAFLPAGARGFAACFAAFPSGYAFPARLAALQAPFASKRYGSGVFAFTGLRLWLYVLANGNLKRLVREHINVAGHTRALLHAQDLRNLGCTVKSGERLMSLQPLFLLGVTKRFIAIWVAGTVVAWIVANIALQMRHPRALYWIYGIYFGAIGLWSLSRIIQLLATPKNKSN